MKIIDLLELIRERYTSPSPDHVINNQMIIVQKLLTVIQIQIEMSEADLNLEIDTEMKIVDVLKIIYGKLITEKKERASGSEYFERLKNAAYCIRHAFYHLNPVLYHLKIDLDQETEIDMYQLEKEME